MKRWVFKKYGDPSVLEQQALSELSLKTGQMKVRTSAFSLNPIDWKLMKGSFRYLMPIKFPSVPCFDLAGVVEDANGAQGFSNGDKIYVRLKAPFGGAAATHVGIDPSVAAKIPEGMSFERAASIPLAGLTALQGLRDHGGMRLTGSPSRVLIIGASGGVGHFAVQIAVAAGAHVTAVCGTSNVDFVKRLGAQEIIDYRKQEGFRSADGRPYDIVLDCVGQSPLSFENKFAPILMRTGIYVTPAPSGQTFARILQFWRRPKVKIFVMRPSRPDLEFLSGLYLAGKLSPTLDSTYPWDRLPEAFARSLSGRAAGKIVVTVP